MHLALIDWVIIVVYLGGCMAAGLWMRRYVRGVEDFAVAGRSMDLNLGIASLAIEYGGEADQGGVYHSNYDSFDHYVRFGDPGFVYGIAEAQTIGHTVLRVADADVLPLQFVSFADTIDGYLTELHELADHRRKAAEDRRGNPKDRSTTKHFVDTFDTYATELESRHRPKEVFRPTKQPKGVVVSQKPQEATEAARGSQVTLVIDSPGDSL